MARERCILTGFLCFVICLTLAALFHPVVALAGSSDNVKDDLSYLSMSEITTIQSEIDQVVDAHGLDVVIVITDQTEGKSSRDYADDCYDFNDFGIGEDASGLLLLINMEIREVWISTTGKAIGIFTDTRIDRILDELVPFLTDGDYYKASMEFIRQVDRYAQSGIPQGQYQKDEKDLSPDVPQNEYPQPQSSDTYWSRAVGLMAAPWVYFIALAVSILATVIASSGNKGRVTVSNRTYEEGGSFLLTDKRDDFINQTVTRVRIANNNSSGGGRSTTHRSSSGRSHGGGGRRF